MRHIFKGKSEEWRYEQEYRIVIEGCYFALPKPVKKLLLGPLISEDQVAILRKIIPLKVEIVRMQLDQVQGTLAVNSPDKAIQPTPATPLRFAARSS